MTIQERNLSSALKSLIRGGARGNRWYVDPAIGTAGHGKTWEAAYDTLTETVSQAAAGDVIYLAPGTYDEAEILIPRALNNLTIIGIGGRGSAFIEPSATAGEGMDVRADDFTLVNVGVACESTADYALRVFGRRFRAYGCKFEGANGTLDVIRIGPGTDAQITAGTHGKGDDSLFDDCEIAYATRGVVLTASDYGATTQNRWKHCWFHGLSAASFEETGGDVSTRYRDLFVEDSIFGQEDINDDGTYSLPTKWFSLNDNNSNTGVVSGCRFPDVLAGGRNLVSTGLIWTGNFHTGGLSTDQPS